MSFGLAIELGFKALILGLIIPVTLEAFSDPTPVPRLFCRTAHVQVYGIGLHWRFDPFRTPPLGSGGRRRFQARFRVRVRRCLRV